MRGLIEALRAEHAAIFGYGVVGARLSGSLMTAAKRAENAHRKRRDALLERLADAKRTPPPAEPAYRLPFEVSDSTGAVKLAVHLEERTAAAWRAAIGGTKGDVRKLAVDALIDCAIRASRWRAAAELEPTVPLPGITR